MSGDAETDLDETAARLRQAARDAIEGGTPPEEVAALLGIDRAALDELLADG